jgi:glutamate dehydrogenase (NAD(P)+)
VSTTRTQQRSGTTAIWKRYSRFLRRPPELTMAWTDPETGARAWLIIDSLRGGAAGGGTRMRAGLSQGEVVYLSKAMALKFAIAGPAIGGAKSGIAFDPRDPRRTGVLERWYDAIEPYLRSRYGTGGDLGVDEVLDVIPCFRRLGLEHPQQGVVRGHLRPDDDGFRRIMASLDHGVRAAAWEAHGVAGLDMTVADAATGWGLAESIRRLYEIRGESLEGVRVSVEGFGNVGASCALYLARMGARITAIADADRAIVDPGGLDAAAIAELMRRSSGKLLPPDDPRTLPGKDRYAYRDAAADVYVAAAISDSLDAATLDRLAAAGVRVIGSGANHPFREVKLGSTRVQQNADRRFAVLPDIVANCGMARAFSYLMEPGARPEAEPVLGAIAATVRETVDEVAERAASTDRGLLGATLGLAMDRVGTG